MSSSESQPMRKVRMACRRCRVKRIKCDGNVPACGNCEKAREPCIDVDGRNKGLSIPRDFATSAKSRIEWLENNIRRLSPEFNFNEGPKVDFSFLHDAQQGSPPVVSSPLHIQLPGIVSTTNPATAPTASKRTYSVIEDQQDDRPFTDEARSVALDLGMLSLNSDSRQTHYLGTSSGRLFTSLIGLPATPLGTSKSTQSSSFTSTNARGGPYAVTRQLKESCRQLYQILQRSLPPIEDARILLDAYFRNVHVDHPFVDPVSLINALDALYQCATEDPNVSIGYNCWVESVQPFRYNGQFDQSRNQDTTPISVFMATFHVFMVFTLAATIRTRKRIYDFAPNQFYRVAMSVSQEVFSTTSVAGLQATLLLAVHSLLTPAEVNIWTLTHIAMAHCIDLGLHRATISDGNLSSHAITTRKLVFHCVYHLDRSVATIQGRPLGIRDETFDVQLPAVEDVIFNSMDINNPDLVPEVSISDLVAVALHRYRLDPLISEIKMLFYHLPTQVNAFVWPTNAEASQASIRQRLEDWRDEITDITSPLPLETSQGHLLRQSCQMKLRSQFCNAMILLHQPSQAISQPSENSLLLCYQCAASRLQAYDDLYNNDCLYQSWRSVQGIFSSGATMIYCLWTSNAVRHAIPYSQSARSLRICTNLLSVGGEWWPSVRKGKESFGRAMDALLGFLESSVSSRSSVLARPRVDEMGRQRSLGFHMQRSSDSSFPSHSVPSSETSAGDMTIPGTVPGMTEPFNFNISPDWTILNTNELHNRAEADRDPANLTSHAESQVHDLQNFLPADSEFSEPTIEAFLAEFLDGGATWNPF